MACLIMQPKRSFTYNVINFLDSNITLSRPDPLNLQFFFLLIIDIDVGTRKTQYYYYHLKHEFDN